jgi:sec-independent protein translocase protein TatB
MLRSMFGIGGSEILVILVVALLFLGPDKLPDAAKTISKGIRDLKKQSRALQNQIESDETIGGAIRDLKSALRGDEAPHRPPVRREPPKLPAEATEASVEGEPGTSAEDAAHLAAHGLTLPPTAGEPDDITTEEIHDHPDYDELGHLIKPAAGTVAKSGPTKSDAADAAEPPAPTLKHG